MRRGVELLFVFDRPDKPEKRGKGPNLDWADNNKLLRDTLIVLGIGCHIAPGEAEAECAALQREGIVDSVWSDDGDAFVFGCGSLVRFHDNKDGKVNKSVTLFRLYELRSIQRKHPRLDREALVLFAILCGGDYNEQGLVRAGPELALKATQFGLGSSLCKALKSDLDSWREQLVCFLQASGKKLQMPQTFPSYEIVQQYNHPLISDPRVFKMLEKLWASPKPINEEDLAKILEEKYHFSLETYLRWMPPALLMGRLCDPERKEYNIPGFEVKSKTTPAWSSMLTATFPFSAISSFDPSVLPAKKDDVRFDSRTRVECEGLAVILRRALPQKSSFFSPRANSNASFEKSFTASSPSTPSFVQSIKRKHSPQDACEIPAVKRQRAPKIEVKQARVQSRSLLGAGKERKPLQARSGNGTRKKAVGQKTLSQTLLQSKPVSPSSSQEKPSRAANITSK